MLKVGKIYNYQQDGLIKLQVISVLNENALEPFHTLNRALLLFLLLMERKT